ncbi:hypothetical protein A2833_01895 [Candidatus Azambacteria bacterium RIFCSPHIGHO2_01_FULL_44_55]|uniref:DUF155 domain-containing protein n=1 Tax=Candidatus Azambacteria bacterium RIFCSPLOWO2_02_FULL_44_14 TaxID=1797306 RepID=A0A1F5CB53_9BACT|nr:MAG: hypothetical protein A3A18_02890 [Candidatus Azambacteria bacterium RIFCSPLOWO2_01_FULL_44_84]OGD32997.1 MAG: hypothetical protein A3C78_01285 [Candidatus Azambacteria bacterium RIFCSPHIGHO2_02_FULL_45_18]OGD39717.1 MAG: hypothetical protein A2833_01895 [Candidatus Azambacteria bacterium RIFCSPHIGHO2_01_FULL_44_55]OGD40047.1 MAG: hypothetical protein A3I30_02350 [Candidatus Azambacteria bacterium RIFCSPLOWO2_02_FULL_44_14]
MTEAPKTKIKGTLVAFVVGHSSVQRTAKEKEQLETLRSAPHYLGLVPAQKILTTEEREIKGKKIAFTVKTYTPDIVIVEATVELGNIFDEGNMEFKDEIINACREALQKYKVRKDIDEEYSVWAVGDYEGSPDTFLVHADKIAGFLKSEKLPLDEKEIESTLQFSLKYAQNDLAIVDWDGAFIFEPKSQFGPMIELIEIANLQLLRYRILDNELDIRMKRINELLREREKRGVFFKSREIKQVIKELILMRSSSILEFESTERNIKLIGDWYSARLYDLIGKKCHFEEWRQKIQMQLNSIEDIYSLVSENFNVSVKSRLEMAQLVGWMILMVAWSILVVFEFASYLK